VELHELRSPKGAHKRAKRIGRGTGSGKGKTSGRGQKGQLARSQGFRLGFEGGQMPLAKRLPALGGFTNRFKKVFTLVNLTRLNGFEDGAKVTPEELVSAGLADPGDEIKILGAGKLRRSVSVAAHAVSESARQAIEGKGGSVTILASQQRQSAGARKREKESAAAES
jgi:large subunit ribosomal protein L15